MKVCIPSELPGGMMARYHGDFESCEAFTLIEVYPDGKKGVEVIHNMWKHETFQIPSVLMGKGVTTVILKNIYPGLLETLWQNMMRVYIGEMEGVEDNLRALQNGFLAEADVENIGKETPDG